MKAGRTAESSERSATEGQRTYRGTVVEVHKALLDDGRTGEATALVQRLALQNEKLARDLAQLRQRFSKKGEGVDSAQLDLLLERLLASHQGDDAAAAASSTADETAVAACESDANEQATTNPAPPPVPKGKPTRRTPPENLERRDNPLLVPAAERCCPECGCEMKTIEFEPTDVIDFVPAQVFVRVDLREKIGCPGCREVVVRAPLGDKVIPGGAYGSALVAECVVDKYRAGGSLHRVRERFQRLGIDIPSATMSDQILWATDLCEPIYREFVRQVVNADVMQLDGTRIDVMHEEKGVARQKFLGTLTGAIGDGQVALYTYASTGHKVGLRNEDIALEDLLRMRPGGYVLADASNHFDASFARKELIECGCSMHARRGFKKALDAGNQRAAVGIRIFKQLYDIEEDLFDVSVDERTAGRMARSAPIYDALAEWCRNVATTETPSSLIAIAARYVLNHEAALRRFIEDGRLPIDNGAVERMHRRVAIVRKNMLFAGSHDGARRAAVIFSVLATAELIGLNPSLYLADVLPKLARGITIRTDLPALMPAAWLAAHPEARVPKLNSVSTLTQFRDA